VLAQSNEPINMVLSTSRARFRSACCGLTNESQEIPTAESLGSYELHPLASLRSARFPLAVQTQEGLGPMLFLP
jgi:hypothetical protein